MLCVTYMQGVSQMTLLAQHATGGNWQWNALTSPTGEGYLLLILVSLVGIGFLLRALVRLGQASRQSPPGESTARAVPTSNASDHSGSATLELVLVLPFLLFLILLLAQTTWAMVGNFQIYYSAYAATRTAIVQIPCDYSLTNGEGSNVYTADPNFPKYANIHRAAVIAVASVGGNNPDVQQPAGSILNIDALINGISDMYTAYNKTAPNWVTNGVLANRLRYADANTEITVSQINLNSPTDYTSSEITKGNTATFGPKDQVTVQVTHNLDLSVPFARRLFAQYAVGNSMYRVISAQYTLTNEGIDTKLPPLPSIPRIP